MPKRHHITHAQPADSASPNLVRHRLEETIENEWLGLGDTTLIPTGNPLEVQSVEDIENPTRHFLRVARDPRFFSFSCKHFLNREVSPMQACVLWELWHRPFPMLLGGRGFGKCVTYDTLIATNDGFREIGELVKGGEPQQPLTREDLTICGENGYKSVAYAWNNGRGPTIKMLTRQGYELEGTPNHPVRVVKDGGVEWRRLDELRVGDRIPIDRNPDDRWHETKGGLDEDTAYLFGLLVGDGCYTQKSFIGFTSADPELVAAVSRISLKVWGKEFRRVPSSKYQHNLYSRSARESLFEDYGFRHAECENKCFPDSVMRSSRGAVAAFIRGLMDTDGTTGAADVSCTAKSFVIIKQLQFCLSRFGIASRRDKYWNKKYQRYYWKVFISGGNIRRFKELIGFGLTRKRQKLERICSKKVNENIDLIPRQLASPHFYALRTEFFRRAPAKRNSGRQLKGVLAPNKFETYELSYERLGKILEATRSCEDTDAWKKLSDIHRQHHFYDTIESLAQSQNETCDVHVPGDHSFVSNGIISHNSTLLAFYIMLRALLCQGSKIVIVGAVFRQSKVVFNYCDAIWRSSPILRSMANPGDGPRHESDRLSLQLGESQIVGLPVGDGTKIRGERASILIADEFSAQKVDVFENVISGFAAVSLSPIEKTKQVARLRAMQRLGVQLGDLDLPIVPGMNSNQTILAGTCYYSFNHSYDYWKHYKAIIESRGDKKVLDEIFKGETPEKFNWKDFSIIRVPANMLPEGYMDDRHISKAKATLHRSQYLMEYGACWVKDSDGFFKRTLVESCVVGRQDNPIELPSCGTVRFSAALRGDRDKVYVMGVDPASESDNFAIVVLEVWGDHRRIVFCWTTTRRRHRARLAKTLTKDENFYTYAARKIRDLCQAFPCIRIAMDKMGGGISVEEALRDSVNLEEGEIPILPVIEEGEGAKEKDTDRMPGEHILELVKFANADYVSSANHGMRKDFEDKLLLFPEFDSASVGIAYEEDRLSGRIQTNEDGQEERLYDTLEDCILDIEELKEELASIVHTQTGATKRDHWDTPEGRNNLGQKTRSRKDRYSALLMANMAARTIALTPARPQYHMTGGFAHDTTGWLPPPAKSKHQNPSWYDDSGEGYSVILRGR